MINKTESFWYLCTESAKTLNNVQYFLENIWTIFVFKCSSTHIDYNNIKNVIKIINKYLYLK